MKYTPLLLLFLLACAPSLEQPTVVLLPDENLAALGIQRVSIEFYDGNPRQAYVFAGKLEEFSMHIALAKPTGKTGLSGESVLSMGRRNNAEAGVNGGFFWPGGDRESVSIGPVKSKGKWSSLSLLPRAAVGWNTGGKFLHFGRIESKAICNIAGAEIRVDSLNQPSSLGSVSLYNKSSSVVPLDPKDGVALLLADGKYLRIVESISSKFMLEAGQEILFLGYEVLESKNRLLPPLDHFQDLAGKSGSCTVKTEDTTSLFARRKGVERLWDTFEYVIGAGPLLLFEGEVIYDELRHSFMTDDFYEARHPRTGICVDHKNNFKLIVATGRNKQSFGMTIAEFRLFLKEIGCYSALNLDGGGSSVLVSAFEEIAAPSGDYDGKRAGQSRPAPNAILVKKNM